MYNHVGFTLRPRLERGVKPESCAATSALLFNEVHSDISPNCHQICRSTHADHFVSHLAYVSNQCVISAFRHRMSLKCLFGWAMSVSSFLVQVTFCPACIVTDYCQLQACMQQQIDVLLSLIDKPGLPAGFFNTCLSLWLLWCFYVTDFLALYMISDVYGYGMLDFEIVMYQL